MRVGWRQVRRVWTTQVCGDGLCDAPFEFRAFGELHPVVVVLTGSFLDTNMGPYWAESLRSFARWNLCWKNEARSVAGLEDLCYFSEDQEFETLGVRMRAMGWGDLICRESVRVSSF
jgi:hypothetical protein